MAFEFEAFFCVHFTLKLAKQAQERNDFFFINLQLQAQLQLIYGSKKKKRERGMRTGICATIFFIWRCCCLLLQSLILPTLKILLHNVDATMEIS